MLVNLKKYFAIINGTTKKRICCTEILIIKAYHVYALAKNNQKMMYMQIKYIDRCDISRKLN